MKSHLDLSGLKSLEKKLKDLSHKQIEFGYPEGSGQHSKADMSYAELATLLEFGRRGDSPIPPRPALRATTQDLKTKRVLTEMELAPVYKDFLLSKTASPMVVVNKAGKHVTEMYQDRMYTWLSSGTMHQDNDDTTIEIKGFNQPYVETGELIRNAKFIVK